MNHRKLISETIPINITSYCDPFCDPTDNISGYCPDICFYNCPLSCTTSYISPPHVTITTINHSKTRRNLHHSLIITFSFIGLVCLLYCLFTTYKRMRKVPLENTRETRDQEFLDEEQGPIVDHPIWYIRTVGLQPSVIDLITVCKYKKGEGLVEGTDCSVCLSEFEDDETLRLLPKCNHAFHLSCIDMWLGSHTNCPLCRAPIVSVTNGTLSPIISENRTLASEETEEVEIGRNDRDFGSKSATSSRIDEKEETDEVKPMRRSFSMDSIVGSRLNSAIDDSNLEELNQIKGLTISIGDSSFKTSLHEGDVLMKRSSSCSGKALFLGHNRHMDSDLPS